MVVMVAFMMITQQIPVVFPTYNNMMVVQGGVEITITQNLHGQR